MLATFLALPICCLAFAAQAQEVGMYVADGEGARLVFTDADVLAPGDAITILLPEVGGTDVYEAKMWVGNATDPTANDLMVLGEAYAWLVDEIPDDGSFGIAVTGLAMGDAPDVDRNGEAETAMACTSSESVQLALTEGQGDALRLVWYMPVYLGYDTEPTCSDAFFAAIERSF